MQPAYPATNQIWAGWKHDLTTFHLLGTDPSSNRARICGAPFSYAGIGDEDGKVVDGGAYEDLIKGCMIGAKISASEPGKVRGPVRTMHDRFIVDGAGSGDVFKREAEEWRNWPPFILQEK